MTGFDKAAAYRIDGHDRYDTPEECLVEWADAECLRTADATRQAVSVTVHAYATRERQQLDVDNMSDVMMTTFEEAYADENLRPQDSVDELKSRNAYRNCKHAIMSALLSFEGTLPVTKLTDRPIASRTYSADEVLAVLREVKPAWFKEVANG
jgi:hypothetical protein